MCFFKNTFWVSKLRHLRCHKQIVIHVRNNTNKKIIYAFWDEDKFAWTMENSSYRTLSNPPMQTAVLPHPESFLVRKHQESSHPGATSEGKALLSLLHNVHFVLGRVERTPLTRKEGLATSWVPLILRYALPMIRPCFLTNTPNSGRVALLTSYNPPRLRLLDKQWMFPIPAKLFLQLIESGSLELPRPHPFLQSKSRHSYFFNSF
jgi:hypothetical protein